MWLVKSLLKRETVQWEWDGGVGQWVKLRVQWEWATSEWALGKAVKWVVEVEGGEVKWVVKFVKGVVAFSVSTP